MDLAGYSYTKGSGKLKRTHWEDVDVSFKRGIITIVNKDGIAVGAADAGPGFNVIMSFADGYVLCCLRCIYMPAIDRSLSDCRYGSGAETGANTVFVFPPCLHQFGSISCPFILHLTPFVLADSTSFVLAAARQSAWLLARVNSQQACCCTGVHANEANRLDAAGLGITESFSLTTNLVRLLTENGNSHVWAFAVPAFMEHEQYMRHRRSQKLTEQAAALPADFWPGVYSQAIDIDALQDYIKIYSNTLGKIDPQRFVEVRSAGKLISQIKKTGKQALWWLFWHDVVMSNPEYGLLKAYPADFSPFDAASICFKVMARDALETFLNAHGLVSLSLSDELLDSLYAALEGPEQVSFQWKNPDFPLMNPDLLIRNLDFLLKNVGFIIKAEPCRVRAQLAH